MTNALDYARPEERKRSTLLAFFANATIVYPALILGALYATWLPARLAFGRPPRPMVDSYPHTSVLGLFITYYGMLGAPFVAVISLVLNALYIRRARLTLLGVLVRSLVFLTVWMGCGVLILWDPLSSLAWLMD